MIEYEIYEGDTLIGSSSKIKFVRVAKNGCYKLCSKKEAEGVAVVFIIQEIDEVSKQLQDKSKTEVFALKPGYLHGTEKVVTFRPSLF